MLINVLKRLYHHKLGYELRNCRRVLDVGCGNSSIIGKIPGTFYSVGVDGWEPYIAESKKKGIHNEYITADITKLSFPKRSFDAVICFDVVEHLEKAVSEKLVENMEYWASKKIIIATPNGFLPTSACHQEMRAHHDGNVEFQNHKCGWEVDEFTAKGYRVYGLDGLKCLREAKNVAGKFLYHLSYPIGYFFPKHAFRLLAVKDL